MLSVLLADKGCVPFSIKIPGERPGAIVPLFVSVLLNCIVPIPLITQVAEFKIC